MTTAPHEWERLNAYVDGELSPDERAAVAARLAERPDLAAQVAALTRIKATLSGSTREANVEHLRDSLHGVPRRAPWIRIAASLVLIACLGATATLLALGDSERTAWLDQPLSAHERWLAAGGERFSEGGAGAFLAGLTGFGADASVPDLSAARLTITGVRFVGPADGRPAIQIGYSGTRGCRLTLWITPDSDEAPNDLALEERGSFRAYRWHAGDLAYVLVSDMDPVRFALIAETARKVTLEHVQPAGETATALRESRKSSPPCRA